MGQVGVAQPGLVAGINHPYQRAIQVFVIVAHPFEYRPVAGVFPPLPHLFHSYPLCILYLDNMW